MEGRIRRHVNKKNKKKGVENRGEEVEGVRRGITGTLTDEGMRGGGGDVGRRDEGEGGRGGAGIMEK